MAYYTCPDCNGTGKVRWGRVKVECSCCDGTGKVPYRECPDCHGRGRIECSCTGGFGTQKADKGCQVCSGSGIQRCPRCRGTGKLK